MIFTEAHQNFFATLSHDINPLHLDAEYAYRTPYGERVVYGVLSVLRTLGEYFDGRPIPLQRLQAQFLQPVVLGETYSVKVAEESAKRIILTLDQGPTRYVNLSLQPVAHRVTGPTIRDGVRIVEENGEYAIDHRALSQLKEFTGITPDQIPLSHLQVLCWSSYFVGMRHPGKQALYSGLEIELGDESPEKKLLVQRVSVRTDERFGLSSLICETSATRAMKMTAFHRPLPVKIAHDWSQTEGSDQRLRNKRAFITGASRGFGSALALACAQDGASLHLSYNRSSSEMSELLSHIREQGREVQAHKWNLYDSNENTRIENTELFPSKIDLLFLNATPAIRPRHFLERSTADVQAFIRDSLDLYLNAFRALVPHLQANGWVICISSTFVTEPVPLFAHYIAAKSAMEGLTHALSKEFKTLNFLVVRLPKMLTDQTNVNYQSKPVAAPRELAAQLVKWLAAPPAGNYHSIEINPLERPNPERSGEAHEHSY